MPTAAATGSRRLRRARNDRRGAEGQSRRERAVLPARRPRAARVPDQPHRGLDAHPPRPAAGTSRASCRPPGRRSSSIANPARAAPRPWRSSRRTASRRRTSKAASSRGSTRSIRRSRSTSPLQSAVELDTLHVSRSLTGPSPGHIVRRANKVARRRSSAACSSSLPRRLVRSGSMTRFRSLALTLLLAAFVNVPLLAQNESIIVEAESGIVGSQFSVLTDAGVQYVTIQGTIAGGNPTTSARVITFTVTFPSVGTYELYARMRVGTGHVQRRQLLLCERIRPQEPGRRRRLDSDQRPRGLRRVHAPERQGRRWWSGPKQRVEMGEALRVRRRGAPGRGIRGRRQQPHAYVPDCRTRRRAGPRQVRLRPPGRLLHGVRPRQRPARDDGPAASAVYAPGTADRDEPTEVPGQRPQSLAGRQLHGVLESGDARERRQVGQRGSDA